MNKMFALLLVLTVLPLVSATTTIEFHALDQPTVATEIVGNHNGMTWYPNATKYPASNTTYTIYQVNFTLNASHPPGRAYIWDNTSATYVANISMPANGAAVFNYIANVSRVYYFLQGYPTATMFAYKTKNGGWSPPIAGETGSWGHGVACQSTSECQATALPLTNAYGVGNVTIITTPSGEFSNIINVTLKNAVTGVNWTNSLTFNNITGTLSFFYYNINNTNYCVQLTGNGTQSNCTSGASTTTVPNGTLDYTNLSNDIVNLSTGGSWDGVKDGTEFHFWYESNNGICSVHGYEHKSWFIDYGPNRSIVYINGTNMTDLKFVANTTIDGSFGNVRTPGFVTLSNGSQYINGSIHIFGSAATGGVGNPIYHYRTDGNSKTNFIDACGGVAVIASNWYNSYYTYNVSTGVWHAATELPGSGGTKHYNSTDGCTFTLVDTISPAGALKVNATDPWMSQDVQHNGTPTFNYYSVDWLNAGVSGNVTWRQGQVLSALTMKNNTVVPTQQWGITPAVPDIVIVPNECLNQSAYSFYYVGADDNATIERNMYGMPYVLVDKTNRTYWEVHNVSGASTALTGGAETGSTYFNVTNTTTITGTQIVNTVTYQGILYIQSYLTFINTSISTFNATNQQAYNTTSTGTLQLPALNGTNTISVGVPGNYSRTITCTITSPLTSAYCNATGVYDTILNITAKNITTNITNFGIHITNASLLSLTNQTTNGYVQYGLLQGYTYYLNFSALNLGNLNATLTITNNSYPYTFQTSAAPSFNLTFLDELTELLINETITIDFINGAAAYSYNTTNSTLYKFINGLNGPTIIRYSSASMQQRDYIVDVNPGDLYTLTLYDINITLSQTVTATVYDTSNTLIENATITLLRYFVSCNCYQTVQMTNTGADGTAIFYVQALDGHYKWSISYKGIVYYLSTTSEQINSNTRTFVIDLGKNYYAGFNDVAGLGYTVTYNTTTKTLSYIWTDPTSTVTSGCLRVTYLSGINYAVLNYTCATGASGSVYTTLPSPNTTTYKYVASVNMTSTYTPWLVVDTGSVDAPAGYDFGNSGIFLAVGLLIVLVTIFSFSATATILVSVLGVIIISLLGIFPVAQSAMIGLGALIVGISLFLMRS